MIETEEEEEFTFVPLPFWDIAECAVLAYYDYAADDTAGAFHWLDEVAKLLAQAREMVAEQSAAR